MNKPLEFNVPTVIFVVMKNTFIYSLSHPITKDVRYIGKSNRPRNRFNNHLNEVSSSRKSRWVQSLRRNGLIPEFHIVDEVPVLEWEFWERHYISLFESWGFDLTNLNEGGAGAIGKPTSEETKQKQRIAKLGKKQTPEHIEKVRQSQLGKKQPLEAIKKTAAANRGRKNSQEMKDKLSALFKGKKRDPEAVLKMAETNKRPVLQYSLSGEFIKEYPSIKDAKNELAPTNNGLSCHLKGKRKSWQGYKWEYK